MSSRPGHCRVCLSRPASAPSEQAELVQRAKHWQDRTPRHHVHTNSVISLSVFLERTDTAHRKSEFITDAILHYLTFSQVCEVLAVKRSPLRALRPQRRQSCSRSLSFLRPWQTRNSDLTCRLLLCCPLGSTGLVHGLLSSVLFSD